MNNTNKFVRNTLLIGLIFLISACSQWTNFTTYFNTYYNANRLIEETEDEFEYYEESKKLNNTPRIWVPIPKNLMYDKQKKKTPHFVSEYIVRKDKLQPVRSKLDSVIIKGSKILATKRKSQYIEKTLYLMGQAYFYRNEWLMCQVKCGELIDNYPDGEKSPDAHLLLSKSLLIQKKFRFGKIMLSRTVDIAWQLDRYDILSEAFRLMADLSLYKNDLEGAVRPYLQAISQSDDDRLKARWQIDMASILYKTSQFEKAEKAFEKVYSEYDPDYLRMFEAKLYQASCFNRMAQYDKASIILNSLDEDDKFEEYKAYIAIEKMNQLRMKLHDESDSLVKPYMLEQAQSFADTAYTGNKMLYAFYFEKGLDSYSNDNYKNALGDFANARKSRSPVFKQSARMYKHMQTLFRNHSLIDRESLYDQTDSSYIWKLSNASYLLGRTYEKLNKMDSAKKYYEIALKISDDSTLYSARYMYKLSLFIRANNSFKADSLLEVIVNRFPNTEFSLEAGRELGFTDAFLIDSVAELYNSGTRLRKFGEERFAIQQFLSLVNKYPKSDYAPKSLYTVGWVFEDSFENIDSARYYYNILVKKYPNSIYAREIAISLLYLTADETGEEVPDSLAANAQLVPEFQTIVIDSLPINRVNTEENDSFFDAINPMNLYEKGKELFNGGIDAISNTPSILMDSLPSIDDLSPSKLFSPDDKKDSTKTDSLKTKALRKKK